MVQSPWLTKADSNDVRQEHGAACDIVGRAR